MRIAVVGATGRTGRPLVHELLHRGHEVAVLVRDPARLGDLAAQVTVVTGDSRSAADLRRVVSGADAVVSTLGPTGRDQALHTDTARALVEAMHATGVRRFVGVSGAGVDVPGDRKSRSARLISTVVRLVGGAMARDKVREHDVLAASDLDWTLARPPRLVDGEATGRIEHDAHRSARSTSMVRADLARFLADTVESGAYVRQAPLVATGRARR